MSCFLCAVTKFQRDPTWKKPVVPKNGDKPIHGLVSDKNFIVANAVENILAGKSDITEFEFRKISVTYLVNKQTE